MMPLPNASSDLTEVYTRSLLPTRNGYPLASPEPWHQNEDYCAQGVQIGDVGIIRDDGAFLFLFNICLPGDHPFQCHGVPDHFKPLPTANLNPRDNPQFHNAMTAISNVSTTVFDVAAGAGVSTIDPSISFKVSVQTSSSEGGLLVIPNGGSRTDIGFRHAFEKYAAENAGYWFEFAKLHLDSLDLAKSLYLITGCDKTQCYSISSWSGASLSASISLQLSVSNAGVGASVTRSSEQLQSTTSRTGFDSLGRENRTVFLRGYLITQSPSRMLHRASKITVQDIITVRHSTTSSQSRPSLFGSSPSRRIPLTPDRKGGSPGGNRDSEYDDADSTESEVEITIADILPEAKSIHPLTDINDYILEKSGAPFAITHDSVWVSVIDKSDTQFPSPDVVLSRVLDKYDTNECLDAAVLRSRGRELSPFFENVPLPIITDIPLGIEVPSNVYAAEHGHAHLSPALDHGQTHDLSRSTSDDSDASLIGRKIWDLEECIVLNRDVLDLTPAHHPNRFPSLNNLASTLSKRFEQKGQIWDLQECIILNREALDPTPSQLSLMSKVIQTTENPKNIRGIWDREGSPVKMKQPTTVWAGSVCTDYGNDLPNNIVVHSIEQRKMLDGWEHEFLLLTIVHKPSRQVMRIVVDRDFTQSSKAESEDLVPIPVSTTSEDSVVVDPRQNNRLVPVIDLEDQGVLVLFGRMLVAGQKSSQGLSNSDLANSFVKRNGVSIPQPPNYSIPQTTRAADSRSHLPLHRRISSKIAEPVFDIAAVFAEGNPFDTIHSGTANLVRFEGARALARLTFPVGHEPSVLKMALLIQAVSTQVPLYRAKQSCCYFFAKSILCHAKEEFFPDGTIQKLQYYSSAGIFKGLAYVNDAGVLQKISDRYNQDYNDFVARRDQLQARTRDEVWQEAQQLLVSSGIASPQKAAQVFSTPQCMNRGAQSILPSQSL